MLTTPNQLPSPPTTHAEILSSAPFKLRLRARKGPGGEPGGADAPPMVGMGPRKKIMKRAPPRGLNKRRRAAMEPDAQGGTDADESGESGDGGREGEVLAHEPDASERPSTPKRRRFAPEVLPLGLERADFHSLLREEGAGAEQVYESVEGTGLGAGGDGWSTQEDRILVELVLEKLKLTKSDWQDCARSLGKDRGSVGRRWKSLMGAGEVGLKSRPRRSKIHHTWR